MLFAIGAAASAIDLLKSLTSSNKTSSTQSSNFSATTSASSDASSSASTASVPGASAQSGNVSPETLSALLDAQSQSTSSSSTTSTKSQSKALKDLFNQIDGNGDGSITKSEFEKALGAGGTNTANADKVFSKLDTDGDGKVGLDELSAALKGGKSKHPHHAKPAGASEQADPLLKALDESNAASAEARKASSSYANVGQVVSQQAQVSAAASGSTLSVSA